MGRTDIAEGLLHLAWREGSYKALVGRGALLGVEIEVVSPGRHNIDQGADFCEAKIRIDGLLWVGSVEIHRKSSDWLKHGHHRDEAYQHLILHVVLEADEVVYDSSGRELPTAEMVLGELPLPLEEKPLLELEELYCMHRLEEMPKGFAPAWIEQLAKERMQAKAERLLGEWRQLRGDWAEVFYRQLMRSMGFSLNNDAMQQLAEQLPYKVLLRYRDDRLALEALLLGVAGLLEQKEAWADTYGGMLREQFDYYRSAYHLEVAEASAFRKGRLRPPSSPYLRLAAVAALVATNMQSFSLCQLRAISLAELRQAFEVELSPYWQENYAFGKRRKMPHSGSFSRETVEMLIINVLLPYRLATALLEEDVAREEEVYQLLRALKIEDNRVVRRFPRDLRQAGTALESQALLGLYRGYCQKRDCLRCRWGRYLFRLKDEEA